MKRFVCILLTALFAVSLAACGAGNQPTEPSAAPTDAPYIHTQIDEPEWTLAEGELTLEDGTTTYAQGKDFLYFAIVGATPQEMELRFRLDDAVAAKLTDEPAYYITFNGEIIGKASLNENHTVAVIKSADAATEITALATRIRGLAE